jgi:hypothetical protein
MSVQYMSLRNKQLEQDVWNRAMETNILDGQRMCSYSEKKRQNDVVLVVYATKLFLWSTHF